MQPGDEPPEPFSDADRADREPADRVRASPARPRPRTRSSGPTCIARRCIPARSRAAGRAIARRSRTRSSASASATGTRFSSSRRGSTTPPSIRTAFRPRCRKTCSARWSRPFRGWSGPHGPAGLRHRIRPRRSARARADAGDQAGARAVPGRPDQRHHRLRGGGGAGPGRRAQCGRAGRRGRRDRVRPRRGLSRA